MIQKLFNLKDLSFIISEKKKEKKKIILCHGVFDLLHIGHIKHFQKAKKFGDFLVVSVTVDKYVNKGNNRPLFNEDLRAEAITALNVVDAVCLSHFPSAVNIINIVKPNFYFKGADYKDHKKDITKKILLESVAVKKNGGKIIYTNEMAFSSTNLLNYNFGLLNDEQKNYLKNIKDKYSLDVIIKYINKLSNIKVLVLGETIIDQYIFCDALGKSGKEPYLAMREQVTKNYLGGAAAIANNLSVFTKNVCLLSMVGQNKEYLDFIKRNLNINIIKSFLCKKNSPTILKKRFLDNISKSKIFGSYQINDQELSPREDYKFLNLIKKFSNKYDLIVVSDYGHGFISSYISNYLRKLNKFISLNAQVNASNIGYHTLSKYKKIDALIINESELRHEMRNKNEEVKILAKILLKKIGIKNLVVTRGSKGAFLLNDHKHFIECPAFAEKVVDKVGAGDTMLAVISLCLKAKLPNDLSLLLGSVAGSMSVGVFANSKILDKNYFIRIVETYLK
jgi:rfaE bifunctional protein kinase chain/domain/rfaE bifunctional protein nucleotidyltransferase chain/domain